MARQGLAGRCCRKKIRTTRRDPDQAPAADLVRRDFTRSPTDDLWIGDATYIWTDEGWCYLATVIDVCSRRLLGWSITDHLRTELRLDALQAAVATRGGRRNLPGRDRVPHRPRLPVTASAPSGPRAGRWASPSPWAPSATVTTTRWPNRSSPDSSARSSTASTSPPAPRQERRSSPGSTGTTRPDSTVPSATARPPSTNTTFHSSH